MHRFDKISEAFRLLGEALDEDPMLSRWEERAVRAATAIERDRRWFDGAVFRDPHWIKAHFRVPDLPKRG